MSRLMTIFWLLLAGVAGIGTYTVSLKVEELDKELTGLSRDILADQEAIHVLRAEWSYLNDPARLAGMVDRYLPLVPIETYQYANVTELPAENGEGFYTLDKFGQAIEFMPLPRERPGTAEDGDAVLIDTPHHETEVRR